MGNVYTSSHNFELVEFRSQQTVLQTHESFTATELTRRAKQNYNSLENVLRTSCKGLNHSRVLFFSTSLLFFLSLSRYYKNKVFKMSLRKICTAMLMKSNVILSYVTAHGDLQKVHFLFTRFYEHTIASMHVLKQR